MASKDEMSTSQWVQFFRAAGLPQEVSVQYAVVFADNRIQWGMLLDLTKEYLFDMGIHTMGDVIAILKHAKHVHTKEAQEKLMRSAPSSGAKMAVGLPRRLTPIRLPADKPEVPPHMGRVSFQESYAEREVEARATVRPLSTKRQHLAEEESATPKRLNVGWAQGSPSFPQRAVPPPPTPPPRSSSIEGPTLKVVLPARSRQALASAVTTGRPGVLAGGAGGSKRSVFDRLGESTVTSTTDTSLSSKGGVAAVNTVFQRLGPSTADEEDEVEAPPRTVLATKRLPSPYQAVLAAAPKPSRVIRLNSSPSPTRPVVRRQVLPPSRGVGMVGGNNAGGGGTIMLRRSLTEATSGRLGGTLGRFTSTMAASHRPGPARDRLGPKVGVAAATTTRTVRTTVVPTSAVAAAKRASTLGRTGISRSTTAPQSVFSRLGGGGAVY